MTLEIKKEFSEVERNVTRVWNIKYEEDKEEWMNADPEGINWVYKVSNEKVLTEVNENRKL